MRRLAALAAVAAMLLQSCALLGGGDELEVTARFDDVVDLATRAPVMLADVKIGEVTGIELDGEKALVTMTLDPDARVPRDVTARIRRTSVLGERIVDIAIPPDLPSDAPLLEDGDEIERTHTRADLEELVIEGTHVLTPIVASEVATMIDEGARGFGGHGEELGTLLRNFETIVSGYDRRSDDIRAVIGSLNRLNSSLARRAGAHARSVANSARGIGMLREEMGRLESAIHELARLSVGGRRIMEEHSDEMRRFFRQIRIILSILDEEEGSIIRLLRYGPLHNRNTQITEYRDFVQVYQDLIFCGMNDDPSDPARRCKEPR